MDLKIQNVKKYLHALLFTYMRSHSFTHSTQDDVSYKPKKLTIS